jgi:RHS repeat-associated protein
VVQNDHFGNPVDGIIGISGMWLDLPVGVYGPLVGYPLRSFRLHMEPIDTMLWRGKRIDVTGLYYFGARYYDPIERRFLSADPLGHAATPSLYAAFNGDPVNFFDPDGRFGVPIIEGTFQDRLNWVRARAGLGPTGPNADNPNYLGALNAYHDQLAQRDARGSRLGTLASGVGLTAAGFIPWVGDAMDVYTVGAPDSSALDRGLSGGSLAMNVATGGLLPNYGPIRRGLDEIADALTGSWRSASDADAVFEMPRDWPGQSMQGMHQDHAIPRALDPENPLINAPENVRSMPAAMNSVDKAPLDAELVQRFNQLVNDLRVHENINIDAARAKAWQAMEQEIRAHANSVPARPMDPNQQYQLPRK